MNTSRTQRSGDRIQRDGIAILDAAELIAMADKNWPREV